MPKGTSPKRAARREIMAAANVSVRKADAAAKPVGVHFGFNDEGQATLYAYYINESDALKPKVVQFGSGNLFKAALVAGLHLTPAAKKEEKEEIKEGSIPTGARHTPKKK